MKNRESITWTSFNIMSMKAKMNNLQRTLKEDYGYDVEITCKRDKKTVKALMDFQKKHGINPNGVICENTFYELNMKKEDF